MTKLATIVLITAAALSIPANAAQGGIITSAVGVTASDERVFDGFVYHAEALIDQSGLSIGYTSGVTDFETYLALDPTHANNRDKIWATNNNVRTATLDFDLGNTKLIDGLALWNRGDDIGPQIKDFEVYASADASFTNLTLLGSYTADTNLGTNIATRAEVIEFGLVNTQYLRMNLLTPNFPTSILSAGEVAFREQQNVVPEPSSLNLIGLGVLGLVTLVRKRREAMSN